ncbi:trehalose-phosphatase [Mycolicibacillus parakoreensis]|uniref:Trehalose-phosphatase n=1 Tax=Mycolicibacillus parakoreensis TaxID=1069221 RepID=A0ABY3U819_9MYCO|nr:trehalose-phosphatase [Mycolicibacillus parakoreensis]ULN54691.1 trehalose-phosphatase [Mycolicibacillus parakoreensis]
MIIDPRRHDAVLFDLDGVVTDTASVHAAAWADLFDEFLSRRSPRPGEDHSPFTDADYRRHVDGKPRLSGIGDFLAARGITVASDAAAGDTVSGLGERKQALFLQRLAGGVPAFATTVSLVHQLQHLGVGTAIFSASRNCAAVLSAAGIGDLFAVRVDGVTAAELRLPGKPDPAVLWEAARRLGVRPDRCVVVEDAEAGVEAGRAGGFALVIGVDRTGSGEQLYHRGADVVVTDLSEVTVRTGDRRISTLPDAVQAVALTDGGASGRTPAVFFDFDGTLSEIVDDPDEARLVAGADAALRALAAVCPVAVLSGRDLADVVDRVGVPGIWYAGSHGFELRGPDGAHHHNETAAAAIPALTEAADELRAQLAPISGVLVEHKRFAVAVHYRNAAREQVGAVTAAVREAGRRDGLRVTTGREVIELRPDIDWDKGRTLRWVTERIDGAATMRLLPVFVGDDITDEDAFAEISRDGIGIMVRHSDDGDRATSARFAVADPAAVCAFTGQLARTLDAGHHADDDPAWVFAFDGYRPEEEGLREALCTTANGYLGTRGAAPESVADATHYPGTYAAGVFNRLTDEVAGVEIENESLVNLPNWLTLGFRIDGGPWFDLADPTIEVLSYRQWWQLRHAELWRRWRFRDGAGRITAVTQRRITAMHRPNLCALTTTVAAENWSGALEFRSGVDGAVANTGVERYRALSGEHLTAAQTHEVTQDTVLVVTETVQSRIRVAVAARTRLWRTDPDAAAVVERCGYRDGARVGQYLSVNLTAGTAVTAEKIAAVFTGHDHAVSEPALAARREVDGIERYAGLRRDHVLAWSRLWERANIEFGNAPRARRIIRLHLLHLLQTVSVHTADVDAGIPARGLHGEAYRGHIFWDELFVFPVLNLRMPQLTRRLLGYRHRRLPAARAAARAAGYRGALFPWQSGSSGREESQTMHLNPNSGRWNPDASVRAHHIGLAIAYNEWQYYRVSGDRQYLVDAGVEMLVDIARFWVSRAEFDADRGRYVIRGVIGPDEFHSGYPERPYEGIDNNAYTNVMAVWVILRALDALDLLALHDRIDLLEKMGIPGAELDRWDDVTRRMFVPFHDGVISQFEGYEHLEELDWDGYRRRFTNIQRLDRILEADGDDVNRYRVSKQADVLMLFYLLSADELRGLFARLGYRFTGAEIPRIVDYYRARTSDGSTLSAVVHTWVLARSNREQAMEYFRRVLDADVTDIQGGTTAEGVHLAAMAGSIDLVQRCFTGLEVFADRIVINPIWPEDLGVLQFPLSYRGHRIFLRVWGTAAELRADPGDGPAVTVECRGRTRALHPGRTVRFDPAPR